MSDLVDAYLAWLILWFIVGLVGFIIARYWVLGPILNGKPRPYEQYMPSTVRVIHEACFWMLVNAIFIYVAVDASTRLLDIR